MSSLKAIIGLGNPGSSYAQTRHNAGSVFIDMLAQHCDAQFKLENRLSGHLANCSLSTESVRLFKPDCFMNLSGGPVGKLLRYFKLDSSEIMVVYDELDLPPGVARFKFGGGHGGHNGLRDLFRHIGPDFHRLRIGVGHPGDRNKVVHYVLNRPGKADSIQIERAMTIGLDVVAAYVCGDRDRAIGTLHTEANAQ